MFPAGDNVETFGAVAIARCVQSRQKSKRGSGQRGAVAVWFALGCGTGNTSYITVALACC
jgi:hypothetical protein